MSDRALSDDKNGVPNPGSPEAVAAGCSCPVIDNHHGKGTRFRGETAWWINDDCLLHGNPNLTRRAKEAEPK